MRSQAQDSMVPTLHCTEFVLMADELVETSPDQWGPVVDKHLAECPPCLIYLQQILDIQAILRRAQGGQRLSDEEVRRVLDAIT